MEALLVMAGAAVLVIPFTFWMDRRSAALQNVMEHPERHSRRKIVAVNVALLVIVAGVLSAWPFISSQDILDEGHTRYEWLAYFFPHTSLYRSTNAWVTGALVFAIWVAMGFCARSRVRTALAKRAAVLPSRQVDLTQTNREGVT